MAKLTFQAADVKRVVEHAIKTNSKNVLLVHDQGVYLMSGGKPRDIVEGESSFCAYARTCNPKTDADWYDNAHYLVGGDDFGETLPWANELKEIVDSGASTVAINFSASRISIAVPSRKRKAA